MGVSRASLAGRGASAGRSPRRSSREGANVVITGRSVDKGKQALDEMQAGDAAHFVAGDVKDRATRARPPSTRRSSATAASTSSCPTPAAPPTRRRSSTSPTRRCRTPCTWNFWHAFWTMRKALSLHDPAAVRPHHADVVPGGQGRQARHLQLRRGQARHQRPGQVGRARGGHDRHHRQRALPGRHRDRHHEARSARRRRSRWA